MGQNLGRGQRLVVGVARRLPFFVPIKKHGGVQGV